MARSSGRLVVCFCIVAITCAARLAGETIPATNLLISVQYPRDHAYDARRKILYLSQENSPEILRYDLRRLAWLDPLTFDASPRYPAGIDITPDGKWLYAAIGRPNNAYTAHLGRFDLDTGVSHEIPYSTGYREGGGYDIAMLANGTALLTHAGESKLRQVDLATGTVTMRLDAPGSGPLGDLSAQAGLFPSGDRWTMLVMEGNTTKGPAFIYDAHDDIFGPSRSLRTPWVSGGSTNRDGSLFSTPVAQNPMGPLIIRDRSLDVVLDLRLSAGALFDVRQDRLYVLDTSFDAILVYDTNTWSELFRFPVGEPIDDGRYFQEGHMTMSTNGEYLFLQTDSGIRVFVIPEPSALLTCCFLSALVSGVRSLRRA